MPHLTIQYSKTVTDAVDMGALCAELRLVMIKTGIFPEGGIRVRAFAADACSIGDDHPANGFAHMMLRMGAGRPLAVRRKAGQAIMDCAQDFFSVLLAKPHFALSLEIIEIDPEVSWKVNSIHGRLKARDRGKGDASDAT